MVEEGEVVSLFKFSTSFTSAFVPSDHRPVRELVIFLKNQAEDDILFYKVSLEMAQERHTNHFG